MTIGMYGALLVGLVVGVIIGFAVSKAAQKRTITREKERLRQLYKSTEKVQIERSARPNHPGRRARISTATHPRTTNRLDGDS